MPILDILGEIGTLDPWLLRGWLYIFSSSYRSNRHLQWSKHGLLYTIGDIVLSLAVLVLELVLLGYIVSSVYSKLAGF